MISGAAAMQGARRARGLTSYDPSQEAGYFLDLFARAEDVTIVDDSGTNRVSSWTDVASSQAWANATMALRPPWLAAEASLNNRPAVHLNAAHWLHGTGLSLTEENHTFYFIGTIDTAGDTSVRVFLGWTDGTGRLYVYQNTNAAGGPVGFYEGVLRSFPSGASSTGAQILTWSLARSGTAEGFRNNDSLGTVACGAFVAANAARLGANPATGTQQASMRVGRVLGFRGLHDADTRARVWAWGADYYGITL